MGSYVRPVISILYSEDPFSVLRNIQLHLGILAEGACVVLHTIAMDCLGRVPGNRHSLNCLLKKPSSLIIRYEASVCSYK